MARRKKSTVVEEPQDLPEQEVPDVDNELTEAPEVDQEETTEVVDDDIDGALDVPHEEEIDEHIEGPEGEEEEEPAGPQFDSLTVQYAKAFGMTDEEIGEFQDTDSLNRYLTRLHNHMQRFQTPAQPEQPAAPKGDETQQPAEGQASNLFEALNLELDPEQWDESAIGVLNKIAEHVNAQSQKFEAAIKERDQYIGQLYSVHEQQQAMEIDRQLDDFFDGLGDDYANTFGKGSINAINNPVHQANRRAMVEDAQRVMSIQGNMPITDALQLAMQIRFQQPIKQTVRKELQQQIQKRRSQATARPVSKSKPRNKDEQVAMNAIQRFRDMGFDVSDENLDLLSEV